MNNLSHWNKFYKSFSLEEETSFAKFVAKKIQPNKKLLDIGCGNGRDTIFFKKKNLKAVGLDNSKTAINNNKLKNKKIFKYLDFCKKKISLDKFDYIYARFFLHAINENQEYNFFRNCKKISKKKSLIFLEFRTTKDTLIKKGRHISKKERIFGHYRRFIDVIELKEKLKKLNFKIVYLKNSVKFATFKNEKPSICRIIMHKRFKS